MSKTIIIPKRFGYPTLDIVVNGKVYTVESNKEIVVEDHVAEAIENADKAEEYALKYANKMVLKESK